MWREPLSPHYGHDLYTSLQNSSLTQFVQHPTHARNVTDLVFATKEDLVETSNVGDGFCNSNDRAITSTYIFREVVHIPLMKKSLTLEKHILCKLRMTLKETDWSGLHDISNINAN